MFVTKRFSLSTKRARLCDSEAREQTECWGSGTLDYWVLNPSLHLSITSITPGQTRRVSVPFDDAQRDRLMSFFSSLLKIHVQVQQVFLLVGALIEVEAQRQIFA